MECLSVPDDGNYLVGYYLNVFLVWYLKANEQ